jgi:hypothetical protein
MVEQPVVYVRPEVFDEWINKEHLLPQHPLWISKCWIFWFDLGQPTN